MNILYTFHIFMYGYITVCDKEFAKTTVVNKDMQYLPQ